ncbi:hypothetical protein M6D81_30760 [Paenibacillus sp. J5C_2022]|nr:hypothetical protein [Paenibacillus sp. J5C2022]MCU6713090.1 hypothetical protein [Paenibacillus sp. J5C2022]
MHIRAVWSKKIAEQRGMAMPLLVARKVWEQGVGAGAGLGAAGAVGAGAV